MKELEEEDVKDEGEEQSPSKPTESGGDSDPATAVDSTPSRQATDTKTTTSAELTSDPNASKDPSHSSTNCPPGEAAAATPTQGFIQGLLEIHAKPPLEHILPNGEPPLVGVEWGRTPNHNTAVPYGRRDATPLMTMQKPALKPFLIERRNPRFLEVPYY